MSHDATKWLAGIPPKQMTSGAFRVLFHLCDCHNPSQGCFPSQAYLIEKTGLSNGGLNKVLTALEQEGLVSRHRRVDKTTQKKRPTRYMFPFEKGFQPPLKERLEIPENDGEPSPLSGDGAVSTLDPIPSPLQERSRLHRGGDKPVREPVNNLRARGPIEKAAHFWAEKVRAGKPISSSAIPLAIAQKMLALNLCTETDLRHVGVVF